MLEKLLDKPRLEAFLDLFSIRKESEHGEIDVFSQEEQATTRAEELGCSGFHSHEIDGTTVYMPCSSHEEYLDVMSGDNSDHDAPDELNEMEKAHEDDEGIMIAFMLPQINFNVNESDLPKGSEVVSDTHLTLMFLGNTNSPLADDQFRRGVTSTLERFSEITLPIKGRIGGIGRFTNTHKDGMDAIFALVDSPKIQRFRSSLESSLEMVGIKQFSEHGFTPHITIAYIPSDAETPTFFNLPSETITLNEITLAWGNERITYPLRSRIDKSWEADLLVKSHKKQLVYGVVYPLYDESEFDLQKDRATAEEVEKMAHNFMISFVQDLINGVQTRGLDKQHQSIVSILDAVPVESFIAPQNISINGSEIKKGSWIMVTKVFNSDLWKSIESGEINAYSIRGFGKRRVVS